jgi:hypothetical protein
MLRDGSMVNSSRENGLKGHGRFCSDSTGFLAGGRLRRRSGVPVLEQTIEFPVFKRAERAEAPDGKSALIVAPTAAGKSYIRQRAISHALDRREGGTHAYLFPFRALADEVFDTFRLNSAAGSYPCDCGDDIRLGEAPCTLLP